MFGNELKMVCVYLWCETMHVPFLGHMLDKLVIPWQFNDIYYFLVIGGG